MSFRVTAGLLSRRQFGIKTHSAEFSSHGVLRA